MPHTALENTLRKFRFQQEPVAHPRATLQLPPAPPGTSSGNCEELLQLRPSPPNAIPSVELSISCLCAHAGGSIGNEACSFKRDFKCGFTGWQRALAPDGSCRFQKLPWPRQLGIAQLVHTCLRWQGTLRSDRAST